MALQKRKAGKAGKPRKIKANSKAVAKGISAAVHCRRDAYGITRSVTALCDAELLGRVLKSGNAVIDLRTYCAFYDGERVNAKKAAEIAAASDNLNLVGEKSLAAARLAFPIDEKNVKRIAGVPHTQVYKV